MKIDRSKNTGSTSKTGKSGGSKSSDGADFSQFVTGGPSEAPAAAASQSIAQLDALLAVQEVEDPMQKAARKKVRMRANTILDKLEGIRMRMLGGDLTVGDMIDVADVVASHRDKIDDPRLSAIMDEIDLRAQVELAKISVAMGKATL